MTIDLLNKEYSINDQLSFFKGNGDFPFIQIDNQYGRAVVSIYGGQVLSYIPNTLDQSDNGHMETQEVLFVSEKAFFDKGKAIKGGIPICWPWFGKDPEDLGRASHGFARNIIWSVLETTTTDSGETKVSLGFSDTEKTRSIWPYAFNLTLIITVGNKLKLELITQNTGNETFNITQALHTYFSVGDIKKSSINGLDGIEYIDTTMSDWPIMKQKGSVTFDKETDRIYTNTSADLTIVDKLLDRQIHIISSGSNSCVIWNPWGKIAAEMADLQDDDYQRFLCAETTNAASDVIQIKPNQEYHLSAEYEVVQGGE